MNLDKAKRIIRKILSPIRSVGLENRSFTIISNNCWGGILYDIYGLQYRTPTIGLYIFAEDYIRFLSHLEHYLSVDAVPLKVGDSKHKDILLSKGQTVLGIVDDVELVLLHYRTAEDGCEKWNRRRDRIDFNNMLIKNSDQNFFNDNCYQQFVDMKFDKKLFITANKKYCTANYCLFIPEYEKDGEVLNDIIPTYNLINKKKMLNSIKTGERFSW